MQFVVAFLALVATVAATVDTSQPCSVQPIGYGPVPVPNTDVMFAADTAFSNAAAAAVAPAGYQLIFANLNGSELSTVNNAYLGYFTLNSYDASYCSALCDNTTGCVGTNLYFERNPTLLPAPACPNPTAQTLIKCALWGSPVTASQATNVGQWAEQFHVLIAGSNGYMKLPAQACSAISAAYNGNTFSFPTGTVNYNSYKTVTTASTGRPTGSLTTAGRPSASPARGGAKAVGSGW